LSEAAKKDERFDLSTHYGFGENWADYAEHIEEGEIEKARDGLRALLPGDCLPGRTFLDIGCGSGVHSLAALNLGAAHVTAIDFDPQSVATASKILERFYPAGPHDARVCNILQPDALAGKTFDTVYSWGVLHHTGDMWTAVANAASLVAPGGLLVLALYKKTPLCPAWRFEKRFYTSAPPVIRKGMDVLYGVLWLAAQGMKGRNPVAYVREYRTRRGMRFLNDVRDWLGGYPYQSAAPEEVEGFMTPKGFQKIAAFHTDPPALFGLGGSGCAEYVFRKT